MTTIKISIIKRDPELQQRAGLFHEPTVARYSELITEGTKFPAVTVFKDDEGIHWLADGFQRTEAHITAGKDRIEVEVIAGSKRDALLYSVSANAKHGLSMSVEDKRKAVTVLLQDDEWVKWSDRKIALLVGVGNKFVGTVRKEMQKAGDIEESTQRTMIRNGKELTIDTSNIGSDCVRTQSQMTHDMIARLVTRIGCVNGLIAEIKLWEGEQ